MCDMRNKFAAVLLTTTNGKIATELNVELFLSKSDKCLNGEACMCAVICIMDMCLTVSLLFDVKKKKNIKVMQFI